MRILLKTLSGIGLVLFSIENYAYTCSDLFEVSPKRWSPLERSDLRPLLPIGSELIREEKTYIIYRSAEDGQLWMLFDTRSAETDFVSAHVRNTSMKKVKLNATSNRPFVVEGRHRAVEASNGFKIAEELGGTARPYWLNYPFVNKPFRPALNHRNLTEFQIKWEAGGFAIFTIFR
ncbi:MAG: hypothetical protein R2827_06885 [Bdellovibrionales bacterium]